MKTPVRPAVALPLAFVVALSLCPAAHAQLGARSAAEWVRMLDAQARVSKLRVDDVVAALALEPGAKVADIGAGSGVFTLPLAGAVTSSGRVYAVDIEQGLVDHIAGKAREAKLTQVQGVLGKFTDPALPARDLDLAFIYDVL
ncbi:MAG: class I SAM-dependent methyltransferase, partial [Opitutaceae bacterium]